MALAAFKRSLQAADSANAVLEATATTERSLGRGPGPQNLDRSELADVIALFGGACGLPALALAVASRLCAEQPLLSVRPTSWQSVSSNSTQR